MNNEIFYEMTDEMKLLRAFIEAQGYDVEESEVVVRVNAISHFDSITGKAVQIKEDKLVKDYKVTNPEPYVPLPIQSKAWNCITKFIIEHRDDIINDVNGCGGLRHMLDFMERNS
jgi:hypothetical protein